MTLIRNTIVNSDAVNDVWSFPVDFGLRRRLFGVEVFAHPAKLHLGLLQRLIEMYTCAGDTLLDPMAGTGSLMLAATQQRHVILRDVQQEYVTLMNTVAPRIRRAAGLFAGRIDIDRCDARALTCPAFNHIIFSPPYGFETGTSGGWERRLERLRETNHDPRWYRKFGNGSSHKFHYEGSTANTGNKSGRAYWNDMAAIYARLAELSPVGGRMIVVIKNHYRNNKLVDVVSQTITVVEETDFRLAARHGRKVEPLSLWQRRRKEQGLPVVEVEDVLVFEKQVTP